MEPQTQPIEPQAQSHLSNSLNPLYPSNTPNQLNNENYLNPQNLPNPETIFTNLYRSPVTKKQTKKAMRTVAAFMIGGSLLISLARFALMKTDNYLNDPKNASPNSSQKRRLPTTTPQTTTTNTPQNSSQKRSRSTNPESTTRQPTNQGYGVPN